MKICCNVYQAKNGKVYISGSGVCTPLTKAQIDDLHICVYDLEDFDFELYKAAYADEVKRA